MKVLKEFYHNQGLNVNAKALHRVGVRAIVMDREKILMVYSSKTKDYKFPGGGVKGGEAHHEALSRELREECGSLLKRVTGEFGQVKEYWKPHENNYDVFIQTSFYYTCQVREDSVAQELEEYEKEMGFEPAWVRVAQALSQNELLLKTAASSLPRWILRETYVLRQLAQLIDAK